MLEMPKICCRTCFFVWKLQKKAATLHRYPENNLFTLKKLIPIENKKGVFVKRFLFYFIIVDVKYAYIVMGVRLLKNPIRFRDF